MGKLLAVVSRFLLWTVGLLIVLLVPTEAFAYGEAITVTPSQGPVGQTVTVTGTGWQDHASRGIDVPIWIGFGNQVADGHPDANGNFSVSFAIPLNLPSAPDFANGKLTISAIIGNGGSADAIYTVTTATTGSPTSPTTGQSQPPPGWYKNSGPATIYEDSSGLKILWENSYIYQHPGTDNLYWYAELEYVNNGSQTITIPCAGASDPSLAKEHIRGTEGIPSDGDSYVSADATFCKRNTNFTGTLEPGATVYDWAIFHNVPPGGEVALETQYGSSPWAWVNPWYSRFDAKPPADCPVELVKLRTCTQVVYNHDKVNWAGYSVIYNTNNFKEISASWTIPNVTCANLTGNVAFWVGLGGAGTDSLEQIGTVSLCTAGIPMHWIVWEVITDGNKPGAQYDVTHPINTGDHIVATVTDKGNGQYQLTIRNSTFVIPWSWTKTVTGSKNAAAVSTAECIAEAPKGDGNLIKFDKFTFNGCKATETNSNQAKTLLEYPYYVKHIMAPDEHSSVIQAEPTDFEKNGDYSIIWKHN